MYHSKPQWRRVASRFSGSRIHHSKYVSQPVDTTVVEAVFEPKNKFHDFDLEPVLKQNMARLGFVLPTPIQDQVIPHATQGKDIIGLAATGSGKTFAFLLPLLNKCLKDRTQKVLIVAPTRELAQQINDEARKIGVGTGIWSALVIGGTGMAQQVSALRRNPQLLVGTPGRLMDHQKRRTVNLSSFNNVVLDEVDRMLDMGFLPSIKEIIRLLPAKRQGMFFSATLNPKEEGIASAFLVAPIKVQVAKASPVSSVAQDVVHIKPSDVKNDILHDILIKEAVEKSIIFLKTKHGAEKLGNDLLRRGFKVETIHGNKSQNFRARAIKNFKDNTVDILIATDIAARGLDIPNVSHVINYDEPANWEDYIHRIGRTGRAGKKGIALTFVHSKF